MAKIIHSMIRVLDEKRSIDFYEKAFGLKIARRHDFEDFSLIYLANEESPIELELTINNDQTVPYEIGSGYGHLALAVDDLEAEHKRITELGFTPKNIVEFAPGGEVLAKFFFINDPDGYSIEVLQKQGNYK